jgi:hypothetical protein
MNNYIPDRWVMVKFTSPDMTTYKILAGWSGSYIHGQSWKLNSGCTKVEVDGDYYIFHGYSGSTYQCHKNAYGYNSIMLQVKSSFEKELEESDKVKMEILDEETNFMEIDYGD